ncbi:hypothetical protein [Listeria booriae]|uniref:hypothetical protein n=1 Tax=Listeria booriae TaxID=1552123 RepID=UPI0016248476|nr:hypothetical protein [Listeria booriae]MBC1801016.1 hypothetical protein [Listeria booriae]
MNKSRITVYLKSGNTCQISSHSTVESAREGLTLEKIKHGVTLEDDNTHTVIPFESIDFVFIEKLEDEA